MSCDVNSLPEPSRSSLKQKISRCAPVKLEAGVCCASCSSVCARRAFACCNCASRRAVCRVVKIDERLPRSLSVRRLSIRHLVLRRLTGLMPFVGKKEVRSDCASFKAREGVSSRRFFQRFTPLCVVNVPRRLRSRSSRVSRAVCPCIAVWGLRGRDVTSSATSRPRDRAGRLRHRLHGVEHGRPVG